MSVSDRFIFTINPYFHLSQNAANAISEDSPNLPYLNALSESLFGMSVQQLALQRLWTPPPTHNCKLLQNTVINRQQLRPLTPFLSSISPTRLLDAPDISEIASSHLCLITPTLDNEYAVVAEKTKPYLVSITENAYSPHDVYPTFDEPLSHIAVANANTKSIVVADTTGSIFLATPTSPTSQLIAQHDGKPSSLFVSSECIHATINDVLLKTDIRTARDVEKIGLSFTPTIMKQAHSDHQMWIASRHTVHLFDLRQKRFSDSLTLQSPISAIAKTASTVFIATTQPSPKLTAYTQNLTAISAQNAPSRITDILCPTLHNIVVTLHKTPDCRNVNVWRYSKEPLFLRISEYGKSLLPFKCHGALAHDNQSLGVVFPKQECFSFWPLRHRLQTNSFQPTHQLVPYPELR